MPMYMDIHEIPGATAEDVAKAHSADVETQRKYGVEYHKYWFNERSGKIFCLCSAPSPEAAASVHREAHGLLAAKIIEVAPEIAEGFLGGCEVNTAGAALVPGVVGNERDPGIRTVLFTDIVDSIALTQRLGGDAAMALFTCMMRSSETPWAHGAVARSSTPETASWRVSCRLWRRLAARPGSSVRWLNTSEGTENSQSGFGSVPRRESPSRITWISSDRRFNLPRGSVRMLSRSRAWFRTWLPSCALERTCPSRTSEKFHSRASIARSECTLSNSPAKRRRIKADYLSRYF